MSDILSAFFGDSRQASLNFKKEIGEIGFHVKAKGSKRAIDALAKALNEIDFSEGL